MTEISINALLLPAKKALQSAALKPALKIIRIYTKQAYGKTISALNANISPFVLEAAGI